MFNQEFNDVAENPTLDLYPAPLHNEIDELNEYIADHTTDGVYRCLLAKSQSDYEIAFDRLFNALEEIDKRLAKQRYLLGDQVTEPDCDCLLACCDSTRCITHCINAI